MTYEYKQLRDRVFTDSGQRMFIEIRDQVHRLIKAAGAVRMENAIANVAGDSFLMIACVDRMVELGEIVELPITEGRGRFFVNKKG